MWWLFRWIILPRVNNLQNLLHPLYYHEIFVTEPLSAIECFLQLIAVKFDHIPHRMHDCFFFLLFLLVFHLSNSAGVICHRMPYLSISQPHCTGLPPSFVSFFQYVSISRWVLQGTTNEMDSLKVISVYPFRSMIFGPKRWDVLSIQNPLSLPWGYCPSKKSCRSWFL